jgi:hypothetical protein
MATFDERLYNHWGLIPRHLRSDRRDNTQRAQSGLERARTPLSRLARKNGNENLSGHAQAIPSARREALKIAAR